MRAHVTRARTLRTAAIALGTLLACCPSAFALNVSLDISEYAHTAWTIREGVTKGPINAIAQTPDGYLWLGTDFGLVRFDGVKATPWDPPANQHLPSSQIVRLLAGRDGTLWIGTRSGLVSWKSGTLTQYAQLDGAMVGALLEDRDGSIWSSGLRFDNSKVGSLCQITQGNAHCSDDSRLGRGAFGLYQDRNGSLWVGSLAGLWRWTPGPPKLIPGLDEQNGVVGFAEDERGGLLVATRPGLVRLADGETEAIPLPGVAIRPYIRRLLRDRDGGLWMGTSDAGLLHLHAGRVDRFTRNDGLSGDVTIDLFEDREGNIWVATSNGLDRFREWTIPTLSASSGLSTNGILSVASGIDGSVWLSLVDGLRRLRRDEVIAYREHADPRRIASPHVRDVVQSGLPDRLESQFVDHLGRLWVATQGGVGILQNDRFTLVAGVPGGITHAIGEDVSGNVWIANQESGLFRVTPQGKVERIPEASFGSAYALAMVGDPHENGMWFGFPTGGIAYFADGQVRGRFTAKDGLGEGMTTALRFDDEGALWVATEGGLSRLKDGRVNTLTSKNGLPCDSVHWDLEDDTHTRWLYTACGLVRVARSDMDAWVADPKRTIKYTIFGPSDGVRILALPGFYTPQAAKSSDGRLWFATLDGVSVVDPRHLAINTIPPPVHVERITADRQARDLSDGTTSVQLPPLTRSLQIDYTALSLTAPENVMFRYRLDGWDSDWQDVGTRRQAFYVNLPPGSYRFRVIASNNSGVWNNEGATLAFAVAPAYYQTAWFRASIVGAFLMLVAAAYQLRVRQVARQYNIRLEERVSERNRIARDFHDTLLQSFQGVLLKFHAATYLLPDHPAEARTTLQGVIEQASQAISEGRDAVQGLRASSVVNNDLAQAISTLGEALGTDHAGQRAPDFHVEVEGTPRNLAPLVQDDVYRIAGEALRNAFQHAHAKRIEVELHYDKARFRLRVRDDGKGIDQKVIKEGRTGHFGLTGMRERAHLLRGKLAIWSELDSGTELELTIPASVAYAK
jgi:signal transduction histidine kinase/ligand-binding sensor domain-containing protein